MSEVEKMNEAMYERLGEIVKFASNKRVELDPDFKGDRPDDAQNRLMLAAFRELRQMCEFYKPGEPHNANLRQSDESTRICRRVKVRPGQNVPAGDWAEIILAVSGETTVDDLPDWCEENVERVRLSLPVYTKEPEFNRLRVMVKGMLRRGFAKWEASDLATLRMLRTLGVDDITADWTLYAFNSRALAALAELGVRRFVASPENSRENLQYLAESGYDIEFLVQQSTPLFVSLTKPAAEPKGLSVFLRDGLWVTTKPVPRTFDVPSGVSVRLDLSWDEV